MRIFYVWLLIVLAFNQACGRIPASYDKAVLACGELDQQSYANADGLFWAQVDGKVIADIDAQWIYQGRSQAIKISSKGCFMSPKGEGSLKLLSRDRTQALLVDQPPGNLSEPRALDLKPLLDKVFNIQCENLVVNKPDGIGIQILWKELTSADAWQIESIQAVVQVEGQKDSKQFTLSQGNFFLNQALSFTSQALPDGDYSLRLRARSIDGAEVDSATSCAFQLDQSVPVAGDLLQQKVSDGQTPLRLNSTNDALYVCVSGPLNLNCQDPTFFKRADGLLQAPSSGSYILHSFVQDAAGNRSELHEENFYRDASAPVVSISWTNENLRAGYNWALRLGDQYSFLATAKDNSVDELFMSDSELNDSLQCRVSLIDSFGAEREAREAICNQGICRGQSLGKWTPCAGPVSFQFLSEEEFRLMGQQVVVHVQAEDKSKRSGQGESRFWLNPSGIAHWDVADGIVSDKSELSLAIGNDSYRSTLAILGGRSGDTREYQIYYKAARSSALESSKPDSWSAPIPVIADMQLADFYDQYPLISPCLDSQLGDCLWMLTEQFGISDTFAVVPLQNLGGKISKSSLSAKVERIPDAYSMKDGSNFNIQSAAAYTSPDDKRSIVFAATFNDEVRLVSYDGTYKILASVPLELGFTVVRLLNAPQNRLLMLINDRLALYDPRDGITFPETESKVTLRQVQKDDRGYFGLTGKGEPFTLQLSDDGRRFDVKVTKLEGNLGPVGQLIRRRDGSFWGINLNDRNGAGMYGLRPGHDKTWVQQNSLYGWPVGGNSIYSLFGYDAARDQLFFLSPQFQTSNTSSRPMELRQLIDPRFVDVTEQGMFRSDRPSNPTASVVLSQDKSGRICRLQQYENLKWNLSWLDESGFANAQPLVLYNNWIKGNYALDQDCNLWTTFNPAKFDRISQTWQPTKLEVTWWKYPNIDSKGRYWGFLGSDFDRDLHMGLPDGSVSIPSPLPAPYEISFIRWKKDRAWLVSKDPNRRSDEKVFELDTGTQSIKEDLPNPVGYQPLDFVRFSNRRVGLFAGSVSDGSFKIVRPLRIFEEIDGKWAAWPEQKQPVWPSWYVKGGQALEGDGRIFYEERTGRIWVSSSGDGNGVGLAFFENEQWTFHFPETEGFNEMVEDFLIDNQGRLVLGAASRIYIYNR